MPRLGETMEDGTIGKWLIAENDNFTRSQIIVEIETDKTTVELPALQDGVLKKIIKNNGEFAKNFAPSSPIDFSLSLSTRSFRLSFNEMYFSICSSVINALELAARLMKKKGNHRATHLLQNIKTNSLIIKQWN